MNRSSWEKRLSSVWYGTNDTLLVYILLPLSWIYCAVVAIRRLAYEVGLACSYRIGATVIVVGNITAGGAGKTPLVISLVALLKNRGYSVGIISRGYAGAARHIPVQAFADSSPLDVGDEAVLLAGTTGVPVFIGSDRVAAARALLALQPVDIIISDDGMQHYALQRDLEMLVIDGQRQLGNRHCLPAGPLREHPVRLRSADAVIEHVDKPKNGGFWMHYSISRAVSLKDSTLSRKLAYFIDGAGYVIAGIGNNQRFFSCLQNMGIDFRECGFADHHAYSHSDLAFVGESTVLMTDKDAVKCQSFAKDNWWRVPLETRLAPELEHWIVSRLDTLARRSNTIG